jgi:tetratricopeptide (TPR) repeat protein
MIGDNEVTIASNCNLSNYFEGLSNVKYRYVKYLERSTQDWDYGIFGINYIHPYLLKNKTWQSTSEIKTYFHKGNPIAVLLIRKSKDDYEGINMAKKGNFEEAKKLLEHSLEADPQNVWLLVELARLSLFQGENDSVKKYIQKGREIYPWYEPFYLLEAQQLFDEKRYNESYATLEELIGVNQRYKPAAPLLAAVKEKLGIN